MSLSAALPTCEGSRDPAIASRAKLQIGRSGRHIAQESIQLHGGIGMTAEYPVGHYAARLTAIEHTLGSTQDHLRVLIDHIADYDLARLYHVLRRSRTPLPLNGGRPNRARLINAPRPPAFRFS